MLIIMWKIKDTTLKLEQGDITEFEGDAIVNCANTDMVLGAGVAGAIFRKGGQIIQDECNAYGSIFLGEAAITTAGNLQVKKVIHAAAMKLGDKPTENSLRESILNSLRLAEENDLTSIAFPPLGTCVGEFPKRECAQIFVNEFKKYFEEKETKIKTVVIYLLNEHDYKIFDEEFVIKLGSSSVTES